MLPLHRGILGGVAQGRLANTCAGSAGLCLALRQTMTTSSGLDSKYWWWFCGYSSLHRDLIVVSICGWPCSLDVCPVRWNVGFCVTGYLRAPRTSGRDWWTRTEGKSPFSLCCLDVEKVWNKVDCQCSEKQAQHTQKFKKKEKINVFLMGQYNNKQIFR